MCCKTSYRGGDLHGSENYEGVKREDEITASAVDRFLSSTWRGNEKPMFSEDIEKVGCIKIMESLTDEEKISMPDVNMAIRYFRAEKVKITIHVFIALKYIYLYFNIDTEKTFFLCVPVLSFDSVFIGLCQESR